MNFGFDAGNAIGSVINGGMNLYASLKNIASQNRWARRNYEMQIESQREAEFMNRNQFQVQSADAQKAGINPLAMQGGQVSSASAQNVEAPQLDISGLSNVIGAFIQQRHETNMQKNAQEFQSSENAKDRRHEEILESLKIDAENKRHSESLAQSKHQFDVNLEEIRRYHDQIKEIESSRISNDSKRIQIEKLRYEVEKTSADALNSLRTQQKYLNTIELRKSARDLASQILTGFSSDKSGMYGFIERIFNSQTAEAVRRGTSSRKLTPDELAEYLINAIRKENE